jgi:hypothetical protein
VRRRLVRETLDQLDCIAESLYVRLRVGHCIVLLS